MEKSSKERYYPHLYGALDRQLQQDWIAGKKGEVITQQIGKCFGMMEFQGFTLFHY